MLFSHQRTSSAEDVSIKEFVVTAHATQVEPSSERGKAIHKKKRKNKTRHAKKQQVLDGKEKTEEDDNQGTHKKRPTEPPPAVAR